MGNLSYNTGKKLDGSSMKFAMNILWVLMLSVVKLVTSVVFRFDSK